MAATQTVLWLAWADASLAGAGLSVPWGASGSEAPEPAMLDGLSFCPVLHAHFQPQAPVEGFSLLLMVIQALLYLWSKVGL